MHEFKIFFFFFLIKNFKKNAPLLGIAARKLFGNKKKKFSKKKKFVRKKNLKFFFKI
jgi:hypothetical protein